MCEGSSTFIFTNIWHIIMGRGREGTWRAGILGTAEREGEEGRQGEAEEEVTEKEKGKGKKRRRGEYSQGEG